MKMSGFVPEQQIVRSIPVNYIWYLPLRRFIIGTFRFQILFDFSSLKIFFLINIFKYYITVIVFQIYVRFSKFGTLRHQLDYNLACSLVECNLIRFGVHASTLFLFVFYQSKQKSDFSYMKSAKFSSNFTKKFSLKYRTYQKCTRFQF